MFLLIATILLLTIHQGQCFMNATATLHPDNSPTNIGNLIFTQEDANSPVHITGAVIGLNASSAHVCLTKQRENKEISVLIFVLGFSYSCKSSCRR
jgi:hypothetical protein